MVRMRRLPFRSDADDPVQTLLDLPPRPGSALRAGSVRLAPGQRVPAEGLSRHGVDEVSLITAGSLRGESGGEAFEIGAGEVSWIPAGEAHWAVAGAEGAEIFWVWFGDVEAEAG
jgi:quercetin dioxygenase-like cupin family protein